MGRHRPQARKPKILFWGESAAGYNDHEALPTGEFRHALEGFGVRYRASDEPSRAVRTATINRCWCLTTDRA